MDDRTIGKLSVVLARLVPDPGAVERLVEVSGVWGGGISWDQAPEKLWADVLGECRAQGRDALESLLVEIVERFPGQREVLEALRQVSMGEAEVPSPAADGGSLKEAIVRDPLVGTELLIAFAEARGQGGVVLLQLKRCYRVLQEIARSRRRYGQTMRHEKRWKQSVYEILELARQLGQ